MRRAIVLIVVLSVMGFGLGFYVDNLQRNTARAYLDELAPLREAVAKHQLTKATEEQAYLHAKWQHDQQWLSRITSHLHTREVSAAMLELSTALEQGWRDEALRALDKLKTAFDGILKDEYLTAENLL
ncbi:MAG: DUF4363 family protein [Clostridia bacterium]